MNQGKALSLRDYARILWRRRLTVLIVGVAAPAAAVALSVWQAPVYQASAQVLLSNTNLAAALTGVTDSSLYADPVRLDQTQADLASAPAVAQLVLKSNPNLGLTAAEVSADVNVTPRPDSNVLDFMARNRDPNVARTLATSYARAYTVYRRGIDTAATSRALAEANRHLSELQQSGDRSSALYASLAEKAQTLQTMEALQTSNAFVIRTPNPKDVAKVSPKPVRNGVLALALGLLLGIGLAFLRETLDTKIRSADEIAHALHLPLLARIPAPPKRLASKQRLVSLAEPTGSAAEAFRLLRTNLDFVCLQRDPRSILVTSAVPGEGKSTTAANLAVTLARAGRSVILVDLDLRRPRLHNFFDLDPTVGVTTVALGQVSLDEALHLVPLTSQEMPDASQVNGNDYAVTALTTGLLRVLPSGQVPPNPGEFIETSSIHQLLADLSTRAQTVIIDAPPLLSVGDALTLSSRVDAVMLVTRLTTIRRPTLRELHRVLSVTPSVKLGFVLAGAEAEESYGTGGYYDYYSSSPKEIVREPAG